VNDPMPLRQLGASDLRISPLGLGCWQFSKRRGLSGKFWLAIEQGEIREIVRASLAGGVNWFDTAEVYGWGLSEEALADGLRSAGVRPDEVLVATKWWPALRTARSIQRTIGDRLARLQEYPISLHQVHVPYSFSSVRAQMEGMAALVREGKIRYVGVSNFSAKKMVQAHRALADLGLPLVSNQVKYSLLDRRIETDGTLAVAKELGITIIAYSPLAQGLLSGKFHEDPALIRARPGFRKYLTPFRRRGLERSLPLVEALREIAAVHGKTCSQVALNWLVTFQGELVVAIPGATKVRHAEESCGALSFRLTEEELLRLDRVSREVAAR
jgi:aryl-alcohol dehydrogenase-like predicted oxidoreductase